MNNPDSRRSFLGTLGLGSLGAIASDRLMTTAEAQQPGAEILGAGGVKTSDRPSTALHFLKMPSLVKRFRT